MEATHDPRLKELFLSSRWSAGAINPMPALSIAQLLTSAPVEAPTPILYYSVELTDDLSCRVGEKGLLQGEGFAVIETNYTHPRGHGHVIENLPFTSPEELIAQIAPRIVEKTQGELFGEYMNRMEQLPTSIAAKPYGFEFVTTGGGCTALRKNLSEDGERYLLITSVKNEVEAPVAMNEAVLIGICDDTANEYPTPEEFSNLDAALIYAAGVS